MPYYAPPYPQVDGTRFQYANCGPAVCTELIDISTVGTLRISAPRIRNASGDVSGGIEGALLAKTVNDLTNYLYPFVYYRANGRATVNDVLKHASIGLIINCRVTVTTPYRTNSFTGLHWVTVAGGSLKDGTYKVEDPGTTYAGWKRWPRDLLFRAAEAVGGIWVLQSPGTEDIDKEATYGARVYARPDDSSRVVKRLERGKQVHVIRTTRGTPWPREDGTNARGWHQIPAGFVKGKGLR